MNNYRVAVLAAIILIILFAGAYFIYQKQVGNQTTLQEPTPSTQVKMLPSPTPVSQTSNGPQVSTQPDSGSDTVEVQGAGIQVGSPAASSAITSPITVSGTANVLGNVTINVKDGQGKILGTNTTSACIGYEACPFIATINFEKALTEAGTIEVYNPSTANGSPQYLQQILIRFN